MKRDEHMARIVAEYEALRALKSASSIFDFESEGDPPERYVLLFRGRGLSREAGRQTVEIVEEHRVEVWLHFSYPESPPDIRWLSPLFHPNVSYSGLVHLGEIELPWEQEIGLDTVAERLWDMARMAYWNLDQASNQGARKWLSEQTLYSLPLDLRPLRDIDCAPTSNTIRYQRIGAIRTVKPELEIHDVLYIGDDTPTPELPSGGARRRPRSSESGDVLYIGDE